jgi:hypothetical protein
MEIKSANCAPELKSALPRPIHARRPALKLAAHLPLRGHSAIKLAAGNNPNITISIFPMPIAPALRRALGRALGRTLTAIGSTKLAFLSLHTQIGLFHFSGNKLL